MELLRFPLWILLGSDVFENTEFFYKLIRLRPLETINLARLLFNQQIKELLFINKIIMY